MRPRTRTEPCSRTLADKQQLFEQIVTDMVTGITRPFYDQIVNLSDDGHLANHLRKLAMLLLTAVMQPANVQLRRLVIGEASRFPDLGRAYERDGLNWPSRHGRQRSGGSRMRACCG